jgi:hypothetical protein
MAKRTLTDEEIKERVRPWKHLRDFIDQLERKGDPLAPIAIDHLRKEITHAAEVGTIWAKLRADLERLYGRKVSEWTMSHAAVQDAIIELRRGVDGGAAKVLRDRRRGRRAGRRLPRFPLRDDLQSVRLGSELPPRLSGLGAS